MGQSLDRVMISGSTGRLGREIVKVFPNALAPTHKALELGDRDAVFTYIQESQPSTIVHAAALTGIRECEEDRERAWRSNVVGTENLVDACMKFNPDTYFIYISTACVFDGHRGFYTERDLPYPENFYALTKLLGEFVVKKLPAHLVVRTNFVARERWRFPKAFVDRFGTYLFADDVARGIREVVDAKLTNVVHVCGDRKMSMYELARLTTQEVEPMTLGEYSGPRLTIDMTLDTLVWKKYKISPEK